MRHAHSAWAMLSSQAAPLALRRSRVGIADWLPAFCAVLLRESFAGV